MFIAAVVKATGVEQAEVWPENWSAFNLFRRMGTQWRVAGMGGYVGLDYNVLLALMARMGLSDDEHEMLFDDIRVMEGAALTAMREAD